MWSQIQDAFCLPLAHFYERRRMVDEIEAQRRGEEMSRLTKALKIAR